MSTRISDRGSIAGAGLLVAIALLPGCKARDHDAGAAAKAEQHRLANGGGDLECAIANTAVFSRSCMLEQAETARGLILTVRHANGGFRRLLVTKDGRGVVSADGAAPAKVAITGPNIIDVAIEGDRYRLPATIGTLP